MTVEIRSSVKSEFTSWRLYISDKLELELGLADGSSLMLDDTSSVALVGLACEEYLGRLAERDAAAEARAAELSAWGNYVR